MDSAAGKQRSCRLIMASTSGAARGMTHARKNGLSPSLLNGKEIFAPFLTASIAASTLTHSAPFQAVLKHFCSWRSTFVFCPGNLAGEPRVVGVFMNDQTLMG